MPSLGASLIGVLGGDGMSVVRQPATVDSVATGEMNEAILEALALWTARKHSGAVERIRVLADAEEPACLGLIAFFFEEMGEPYWREGIPYAEKAVRKGMPWVANLYVGKMLTDADLRQRAPDFLCAAIASGLQTDPVGYAVDAYRERDHDAALALVKLGAGPWPWSEPWNEYMERAGRTTKGVSAMSLGRGPCHLAVAQRLTFDLLLRKSSWRRISATQKASSLPP